MLDALPTIQEVIVMSGALESGSARRARRRARSDLATQRKKEGDALATAESEIAITEAGALSGKAGRKSLLKTSPTGLAVNLGGSSA